MVSSIARPSGKLLTIAGRKVHVRSWGASTTKPCLILEAGLTMMSSCWGWLGPALAQTSQVVAYDRSGLGWSGPATGHRSVAQLAAELALLAESLPGRRFIFVGHSLGAWIIRALHREHPDLFARAVFIDPPEALVPSASQAVPGPNRRFFWYLQIVHLLARFRLPRLPMLFQHELLHLPERDAKILAAFLRTEPHLRATVREARAWGRSWDEIRLASLGDIPCLILAAGTSRHFPVATPSDWGASSSSTYRQFRDATHLSLLTSESHAAQVAAAIAEFCLP